MVVQPFKGIERISSVDARIRFDLLRTATFVRLLLLCIVLCSCVKNTGVQSQELVTTLVKQNHSTLEKIILQLEMSPNSGITLRGEAKSLNEKTLSNLGVIQVYAYENGIYDIVFGASYAGFKSYTKWAATWFSRGTKTEHPNLIVKNWYFTQLVR